MEPVRALEPSTRLLLPGGSLSGPRRGGRRVRQMLAALLAVGLVSTIVMSGSGAGAQTVESLRARAEQLANELEDLERRSSELNEQYLEVSEELSQLEAEQAENRRAVDEAKAQVEATRGEATDYLVEAYIGAGAYDGMAMGSDPNEAVNSKVLLEVLRGDTQMLADKIDGDRSDLEARSAELDRSGRELTEAKERQAGVVAELEDSVARQESLLNSANSQLNTALEQERARREAAAAAAAARAAEAAAAQQAARAAAQTTTTQAPSRLSSGGSPSSGSSSTAPAPARAAPAPAPAPPPPPPVSSPNGRAGTAINAAMSRLGTPYRWGGTTPSGFDCSGLMLWSWAQAGVSLPRTSGAQRAYTQRITFAQLQPGDLVFTGNPVYHVGMYIGGGQMIHSPQTGDVVKISAVRSGGSVTYGRIP
ncbi:MAG: NlpC/P60 family protein [Microthrixaceae bacterium]